MATYYVRHMLIMLESAHNLSRFPPQDDTHLFAKWRLQGFLKFPWHPYVAPYTGTTLYTLNSDGLISSHEETWSISALEAARATITPTAGPPKTAESS